MYIDGTHNWWGVTTPSEIASKIYDHVQNSSLYGEVGYDDYLTSPGVEPTSWGSIKALFRQ